MNAPEAFELGKIAGCGHVMKQAFDPPKQPCGLAACKLAYCQHGGRTASLMGSAARRDSVPFSLSKVPVVRSVVFR